MVPDIILECDLSMVFNLLMCFLHLFSFIGVTAIGSEWMNRDRKPM
jgi:hypothetical protein